MQNKNKAIEKMGSVFKIGKAFERLAMFMALLLLLSHFIGCFWIFIARTFQEEDEDTIDSWIKKGEFTDYSSFELYTTSFYFAMTTITTVGYGDIRGNSTTERVICIFLHLIGVLSYSFASGSLTSIITNYDKINEANREKQNILQRIFKEHNLPPKIYYELKNFIKSSEGMKDMDEINEYLNDLPYRLRIRTSLYLYKDAYENVNFLKDQSSESFLAWVCPLLSQVFIPMD